MAGSPRDLSAALGRVQDTAVVDAIQQVQLFYAKADVSFTALFNPSVRIARGPVTVRQIAALYPYDNELYVIEGDGKMVKDVLENAARYFLSCTGAELRSRPPSTLRCWALTTIWRKAWTTKSTSPAPQATASAISAGKAVRWHPARSCASPSTTTAPPAAPDTPCSAAPKLSGRSQEEIRDMMVRYYTERKACPPPLPTTGDCSPKPTARATMVKQAEVEATRPTLQ